MRQVLLMLFSSSKSMISSLRERSLLYAMVVAKLSRDISVLRSISSVGSQRRRMISRPRVSSTSQRPRLRGEKVDPEIGESPEGKMMTTTEEIGNLARATGEIAKSDLIEGTGMSDEIAEIVATVEIAEIVRIVEIDAIGERIEGTMMTGETEVMATVENSMIGKETVLKEDRDERAASDAQVVAIDRMVALMTRTPSTLRLMLLSQETKASTLSLRYTMN
jgi:hypothetical protein